mmetsp:Transcript_26620/g.41467  ORF Transcript_26620/g.41467 Transcript_26620/m.41467 type:complete len:544 (+) Transcript_26620:67-1698(+)
MVDMIIGIVSLALLSSIWPSIGSVPEPQENFVSDLRLAASPKTLANFLLANNPGFASVSTNAVRAHANHRTAPAKMVATVQPPSEATVDIDALASKMPTVVDEQNEPASNIKMLAIGLTHDTAPVKVREQLAVPEKDWNQVAQQLRQFDSILEVAPLSTCNRFEVYFVVDDFEQAEKDVMAFLTDRYGGSEEELRPYLFFLHNMEAERHLLKVASGLDSIVMGEAQILSQVKACHKHAMAPASAEEPAGSAGKVLGRLLNQAVYAGKYVRSEFQLSKGSVSISSAAVELSVMKAQEDLKSSLEHVNVAVVGAGEMSRLLFVHLESHGVKKVTLFNRSPESAQKLKDQFTELETEIHLMDKFESMLGNYDMVFTSTSSRDPIVTKENLEAAGWGNGERSLVLIDISMPSNVEESCNDLDGVHAYDIDELKQVVDRNTARRRKQGEEAEKWIETEIGQFQLWKASVAYQEIIGALNKKYEGVRARVVEKSKGLQDLTDDQRKAVNSATKHLVKQMLNDPINSLRSADIQSKFSVKQLQSLFRLDA